MTHYRLADSTPTAIILARNPRTSSLDELKIYTNNHIFLNNGDEFKIRLFNPLTEKIGVQIGFNGQLSNSMLVLNPGEDVVVDRFLDDQRKMLFETYQYDKNNVAAVNAVAKNGIVEIRFFKEYIQPTISTYSTGTYTNLHNVGGMSSITLSGFNGTFTTGNGTFASFNTSNNNSRLYDQNVFLNQVSDSSLDFASDFKEEETVKELKSKSTKRVKSETGRVEKGQHSDQNFKQVDIQFQTYPFHDVVYNLKPTSEKSTYTREVREYCVKCGYRVRNNSWLYCPKCGEKI